MYNSMLRFCYYQMQWKFAQTIIVARSENHQRKIRHIDIQVSCASSSKYLKDNEEACSARKSYTVTLIRQHVNRVKENLEDNKMCSYFFLAQALYKVWDQELSPKLKLTPNLFNINPQLVIWNFYV